MTHTSEQRWKKNQGGNSGPGLNDKVADLAAQLLDVLYKAEKLGLELEELVDYTSKGNIDVIQGVADQLFDEDWSNRESDPIANPGVLDSGANDFECRKVSDAIDAVNAARDIFEFANKATKGKSKISVLRRMG